MSSALYDRITNISILVAVMSALAFDRAGKFDWLVGGIGIFAGITAGVAYLWRQFNAALPDCPDMSDRQAFEESSSRRRRDLSESSVNSSADHVDLRDPKMVVLVSHRILQLSSARPDERSDKFANQIVQIIEGLRSNKNRSSLEFVLTEDGNFLIREAKRSATWYAGPEQTTETESDALPQLEKVN